VRGTVHLLMTMRSMVEGLALAPERPPACRAGWAGSGTAARHHPD